MKSRFPLEHIQKTKASMLFSKSITLLMKSLLCLLLFLPSIAIAQQSQWKIVKVDSFFVPLQVTFVDSDVGYVGGYQTKFPGYYLLFRTSDGGATWRDISPVFDSAPVIFRTPFYAPSCPTRHDIFLCEGWVDYSPDSGETWITRNDYGSPRAWVNAQMFTPAMGYLYNEQDVTNYKTEDTIKSFVQIGQQESDFIYWVDSLYGIMPIYDTAGMRWQSTTDGGLDWPSGFQPGFPPAAGSVFFSAKSRALWFYQSYNTTATYQSRVYPYSFWGTPDLGATWEADTSFAGRVLSMGAVGDAVWLSISSGDTLTRYHPAEWLAMSYDGVHWDIDSTSVKGLNISAIAFTDASHGWAVGNDTTSFNPTVSLTDSTVGYILKYVGAPLAVAQEVQPSLPTLDLSPNPAQNLLHYQIATFHPVLRAEAVSVLGNFIECPLRSVAGSEGDVDISALAPGMYMMRLKTSEGYASKSFIKVP